MRETLLEDIKMIFIDLFCGAGGVTTGIVSAKVNGKRSAIVVGCVNHDPLAIQSHKSNHSNIIHYTEDIRTLDLTELSKIANKYRALCPGVPICLWASLECTNFSKAKGGGAKVADSRTLANHLFRYIEILNPDYIFIENVEEFMTWGELDENGKPIIEKIGEDYDIWVDNVKSYGYKFDWKLLNSADFGAYTSRKRFFAVFAKPHWPIKWPKPTHSRNQEGLKKWKPVKDVLNFEIEGKSIFNRKKSLCENTLARIYAGLVKYVLNGDTQFFNKYYSGEDNHGSINQPAGTLTTKDRFALVKVDFLVNPQWFNMSPSNINKPCFTLIARMDKAPPSLVSTEPGTTTIQIHESDSPNTIKIKEFMNKHSISDIKMRMLVIKELLKIQGFSENYILKGKQQDQKKFIGNSVPPDLARAIIESPFKGYRSVFSKNRGFMRERLSIIVDRDTFHKSQLFTNAVMNEYLKRQLEEVYPNYNILRFIEQRQSPIETTVMSLNRMEFMFEGIKKSEDQIYREQLEYFISNLETIKQ